MDGDGKLDIAIANDGQENALYFNRGSSFERLILPEDKTSRSYGVTIRDLDSNGFSDVIFANSGSFSHIYLNVTIDEQEKALLR